MALVTKTILTIRPPRTYTVQLSEEEFNEVAAAIGVTGHEARLWLLSQWGRKGTESLDLYNAFRAAVLEP